VREKRLKGLFTWSLRATSCANVSECENRNFEDGGNKRDQIIPVLALLETTEGHLGTRDVLLGVFKVLKLRQVSMPSSDRDLSPMLLPVCLLST
jgi:hypothetical protein